MGTRALWGAIVVACFIGAVLQAGEDKKEDKERPVALPFDVKVGGQDAKMVKKDDPRATVADPVKADAELVVDIKADKDTLVLINIFPADDTGMSPKQGGAPSIIMVKGDNKTKLDQTMDKKALTAGKYIMNVVAVQRTALIAFSVK